MRVPGDGASTKEGSFELPSVPRGSRFTASIEPGDITGPQATVSATVSAVVDHDIDDLQIRFGAPFTIEASIELTGSLRGDDNRGASVGLNAEDGYTLNFGRRQKEGIWRFENVVPGRYQITATPGLSGGYYLSSISIGGQEVIGQFVNLQPGSPPIQVVYKPNAGTVSGTVEERDEKQVVLMPQGPLDLLAPDFGRVVQTGSGGAFEIASVGPGSYYAFAVDRLKPEQFSDAQFVRKIISEAVRVQITEGSAVSVKLKVIRSDE